MRIERNRLRDDEIDPFELLDGLWKQKWLVFLVALVFAGGALIYALIAPSIYEARLLVQPPTQNDISQLNYGRGASSDLRMLSVKDVYEVFLRNLQSESLRRDFFQTIYLPSLTEKERKESVDELYQDFQDVLSIQAASQSNPGLFYVRVNTGDSRLAADWVVRYVEMAGHLGRSEVILDVIADARMKAKNLKQEIAAARESARRLREDQIAQLTEALNVARTIGLQKTPIIAAGVSGEVSTVMNGALTYMRGIEALQAEIKNLRDRASDDPFVPKLRQRQEAADFYGMLQIDPEGVKVYRQDGGIESPEEPVRPKRLLVVFLGFVAGLTFGLGVALLRGVRWAMHRQDAA